GTTCELSAIELRDLRPGHDFSQDRGDFWLFSWDFADARCYVPPAGTPPTPSGTPPPTTLFSSKIENKWRKNISALIHHQLVRHVLE
ncbi:hypothetical protein J6590_089963, partial [Homalodisca vitripennis]